MRAQQPHYWASRLNEYTMASQELGSARAKRDFLLLVLKGIARCVDNQTTISPSG